MLFRKASAGRTADLNGFEFLAVFDSAADIVHNLSQGRPHRHFDQSRIDDIACQGKGLCSGAALCTDGFEPFRAFCDNIRYVCKSLHVVQAGRGIEQTLVDRARGFGARHAAVSFDGSRHGRAFPADERACTLIDAQAEVFPAAENIVAHQAELFRLGNSVAQPLHCQRILGTHIDIAFFRFRGDSRDDHTFDHLVRHAFHAGAVHKRSRVAFITVADDEFGSLFVCCNLRPLLSHRETCAAASADAGIGDLIDDSLRLHLKNGFHKRAVSADGDILFNGFRIDMPAVLQHTPCLQLIERDIFQFPVKCAAFVVSQTFDIFSAEYRFLNDLIYIVQFALGIQPAFRLNPYQGTHFAESGAAGFFHADYIGFRLHGEFHCCLQSKLSHTCFQCFVNPEASAGYTAGAAADKDFAFFSLKRFLEYCLILFKLLKRFQSCTHYIPSFSRISLIIAFAFSGVIAE